MINPFESYVPPKKEHILIPCLDQVARQLSQVAGQFADTLKDDGTIFELCKKNSSWRFVCDATRPIQAGVFLNSLHARSAVTLAIMQGVEEAKSYHLEEHGRDLKFYITAMSAEAEPNMLSFNLSLLKKSESEQ